MITTFIVGYQAAAWQSPPLIQRKIWMTKKIETTNSFPRAGFIRRLAAMIYDALVAVAVYRRPGNPVGRPARHAGFARPHVVAGSGVVPGR